MMGQCLLYHRGRDVGQERMLLAALRFACCAHVYRNDRACEAVWSRGILTDGRVEASGYVPDVHQIELR